MIYFDNSASTLIKPKCVQRAISNAMMFYSANPGRSSHKEAIKTALEIEKVREKILNHTNGDSVIFTGGCTHALNQAILGYAKDCHVVCTENEHNSVLRPLEHLSKTKNVTYSIAKQKNKGFLDWNDIEPHIKENTKLVICNHISNVNGDIAKVEEIGQKLQEKNIAFLVDGAQSGGHFKYDMKRMGISMLALAPHKGFYSAQGAGALVLNGEVPLEPILFGGTGTNSLELVQPKEYPERLESGTLNTPAILAFGAGIDFVEENFDAIKEKMEDLTTYLHYELSKLPVEIYTATDNTFGVFAFNIPSISSNEVANLLNEKYDICVRSGYHCAPKKHEALGTLNSGAIRVSFSLFNTFAEVERLIGIVKHILKEKKLI